MNKLKAVSNLQILAMIQVFRYPRQPLKVHPVVLPDDLHLVFPTPLYVVLVLSRVLRSKPFELPNFPWLHVVERWFSSHSIVLKSDRLSDLSPKVIYVTGLLWFIRNMSEESRTRTRIIISL